MQAATALTYARTRSRHYTLVPAPAFFNQQRGVAPCQPLRTKVHAAQLELAWQAPWQFSGTLFAGREKLPISEPNRSFPYSMDWARAGALKES